MAARIREGEDELALAHEINVTPFIDVILVLLIVFMVAAPLATVDVPVDLPASAAARQPRPEAPVFVTLKADRSLSVGDVTVGPEGLSAALTAATGDDREQRVFVRADRAVAYGELMTVMDALRAAGFLKIGLVGVETTPAP